jgi:hypothetical protein
VVVDRGASLALARYFLWWNSHSLSHGFSNQVCPDNRHRIRLNPLLAVRFLFCLVYDSNEDCRAALTHDSRKTSITYFPDSDDGDSRFEFFKKVVVWHPMDHTLNQLDWSFSHTNASQFALALLTFLYVDIIDATATLYSMVRFCGVVGPKDDDFPRSTLAYCTDAAFISIGSLFGSSPVTAFIESGAGIAEGGRTGLTAIVTGLCFIGSIFFAPIFASIPPWATGCALILVSVTSFPQARQSKTVPSNGSRLDA